MNSDTIAVLPLTNESSSQTIEWIGESVAETVQESLAWQGIITLSRDDRIEAYNRLAIRPGAVLTYASVVKVAESLDASQVIFGSFTAAVADDANANSRGILHFKARSLDLKRTKVGPEFEESGPLEDLSAMQTRLAWQIIKYLMPKAAPSQEEFLKQHPPVRVDAVEHYVRGLLAGPAEQKQKLFVQASKLDEHYSAPCLQLGRLFFEKKDYRSAVPWLGRVSRSDPHYSESQFLSGLCHYFLGDYATAAKDFQTVAESVPLNEVFNDLAAAQSRRNQPQALDNFRKALEGDEADPDYWFNVGLMEWKAGKIAEAEKSFRAVLDRTPNDSEAKELLARCLRMERPQAGEPAHERVKQNFEETAFRQLQAELKK